MELSIRNNLILFLSLFLTLCFPAWTQPSTYYSIQTVAGVFDIGDNGPASRALLFGPRGLAVDGSGNVYIADTRNGRIRKVTPQGVITTVASELQVIDLAVDASGNNIYALVTSLFQYYAADYVLRISPDGVAIPFAGNGRFAFGGDGGQATAASIQASGIAVDTQGNVYLADEDNCRIRKITRDGTISTIAGSNSVPGFSGDNGPALTARLAYPGGIVVDRNGIIYVADSYNHRIRRITADGIITTLAGSGAPNSTGDGGPATLATFAYPRKLALDAIGNLYVTSRSENRVRRIEPSGTVSHVAGRSLTFGFGGDGTFASTAVFDTLMGVAVAGNNIYVADERNNRIRRINSDGMIATIAGTVQYGGDGGPATSAVMQYPAGVAVDRNGNLYISDSENRRISHGQCAGHHRDCRRQWCIRSSRWSRHGGYVPYSARTCFRYRGESLYRRYRCEQGASSLYRRRGYRSRRQRQRGIRRR